MEASRSAQTQFERRAPESNRRTDGGQAPRRARHLELFAPELVGPALKKAFAMLRPDIQWANPVMFVVEIGCVAYAVLHHEGAGEYVREPSSDYLFRRAGFLALAHGAVCQFRDRLSRSSRPRAS